MSQNWQNISDDELDDLFRKAADEQEFAFEADSWAKMNQQLDALPVAKESNRWRRLLPILLILLLSFFGGYYFIGKTSKSESLKENDSQTSIQEESSAENKTERKTEQPINETHNNTNKVEVSENEKPNTAISSNEESIRSEVMAEENSIKTFEDKKVISSSKNITKTSETKERNSYKNFKSSQKSGRENNSFSSKRNPDNQPITNNTTNKNIAKSSEKTQNSYANNNSTESSIVNISDNQSTIDNNVSNEPIFSKNELANLNELVAKHPVFKNSLQLPNISWQSALKPTQTTLSSASFKKGFNIRLSVSPDVSTIDFNEINKIGTNFGLLVEYRFNRRLSFQTGVIRSLKLYDAYPDQYTWIWKMPDTPLLEINATCKMLDIPMNIRYDITQRSNSRWFVGAGVTSYRMLQETYIYNYENNADPSIKWKKWVGSTGSYPLKVINISTGYEKEFRKNLTFQIEPFVKIPTAQVGFGKVNLSTLGVFFSAKYHLGK